MADATAATTFKGSQFRTSKEPGTYFCVLDNLAGGDLVYKILLKKLTWFLR